MDALQKLIHRLEVGGGARYVRIALSVLLLFALIAIYNWRCYKNFSNAEAMDSAQVGRNIAQGKGFTTYFIRPLSIHLLKECNDRKHGIPALGQNTDPAQLSGMHPDLANPPLYPLLLGGLMKVLPFQYAVDTAHQFWSVPKLRIDEKGGRQFWRYEPDFLLAAFNELLFFATVVLVFLLARRLFDRSVAWLSALLLLGSELFWRFSVSGLSTMLLLLIFVLLLWCLTLLDEETREPKWGAFGLVALAAFAGVLVGLGGLTRYSFVWLILPVLAYVVIFTGRQRVVLALATLLACAAVLTPWLIRNYSLSGTPFGTSTFTLLEATSSFPGHRLERSLAPDFSSPFALIKSAFWQKLIGNSYRLVETDLPKLGGTWLSAFFLVGLLVGFRNPSVKRLRYFLLGSLVTLALAQALGRTQLSEDSPEINSENLLILVAPMVLVYGVSLFYLLLEQIEFPFRELRYGAIGLFSTLACLPLILAFLAPKTVPISLPYYPPAIQANVGLVKEDELCMSDIPWAVAWYGQSQCVWLTLNTHSDFFAINDYQKPIRELYLTRATMDEKFLSQWVLGDDQSWGSIILQSTSYLSQDIRRWPVPVSFSMRRPNGEMAPLPLHFWQEGWPDQFVLTFREHWPKESPP